MRCFLHCCQSRRQRIFDQAVQRLVILHDFKNGNAELAALSVLSLPGPYWLDARRVEAFIELIDHQIAGRKLDNGLVQLLLNVDDERLVVSSSAAILARV